MNSRDNQTEFRLPPTEQGARRELDEELRLHFELRVEELQQRGLSADEARREAARKFGDVADAKAYCQQQDSVRVRRTRRAKWIEEAAQDIRFALRQLRRSRAFTFAAVLTMAVGIGLSIAAFSVFHAYLVRPLPYPDSDRLASIIMGPSRDPFPNAPALRDVNWLPIDSLFGGSVAWNLDGFTLPDGERPEYVNGAWVTTGYFSTLGLRPALGRAFSEEEFRTSAPVALISDALWARRFNSDSSIIGRTIRAHSTDEPRLDELVTVVGVMPEDSWHISRFTDVLRPLAAGRAPSIIRVKPNQSLAEAQAAVNAVVLPQLNAPDPAWHVSMVWLQDEFTYQVRPLLLSLLGASVFMLLIGGASVAGVLTARASSRRRELALRAALGASSGRIVRQYLTESVVLSLLAATGGAIVARVLIVLLSPRLGEQLGVPIPNVDGTIQPGIALFLAACGVAAAITFVFNLLPAVITARKSQYNAQTGTDRAVAGASGGPVLRRSLVAAQLALTMMLLVGAGLMTRSVLAINAAPLGFDPAGVLKANLLLPLGQYPDSATRTRGVSQVIEALNSEPGVQSVAVVSPHPFRMGGGSSVIAEGLDRAESEAPSAWLYVVAGDYPTTLGLTQLSGRAISDRDDARNPLVAVVSEGLAKRLWGDADPIGRRVRFSTQPQTWRTVIGVVQDTRKVLTSPALPDIYLPFAQAPRPFVSVLVRTTGDPMQAASALTRRVARVSPVLALSDVESMESVIARDGQRPRLLAGLLGTFATLALSLAILGLYSSLSYLVSLRNRELAVRVAIGANSRSIARLVFGEGVRTLVIGLSVGTIASFSLTGVLTSQLFGVQPTDPITFVGISLILVCTTIVAMMFPAWQASRVDPAIVLRSD